MSVVEILSGFVFCFGLGFFVYLSFVYLFLRSVLTFSGFATSGKERWLLKVFCCI